RRGVHSFPTRRSSDLLVADALELGRRLRTGTPDKNRLCAAFAARHGLFGLARVNTTDDPDGGPLSAALDSRQYGEPIDELNNGRSEEHTSELQSRFDL